mgnify:CR=1 FL=1
MSCSATCRASAGVEPAALVDNRKLLMLAGIVRLEFLPFAIDVGLLGISLRVD